ncbi:MAG TPA: hypothetical protein P5567_07825 [Kiritimatiellia bacterium]|nr:hypothetical protein [Kiritimatiellia bacterium]HRZ12347.1 hypothetical protein [Kiritimatiellia bacterium]HSA17895.1 hypothetical protein [Kiritimatiellia bacterium]
MKTRTAIGLAALALGVATLAASAAFTPPTDEQLNAAAAAPGSKLAALLEEASPDQVVDVVKSVAEKIIGLNLAPEEQAARLADVIRIAFKALPSEEFDVFAAGLGKAVANSAVISGSAGAVTAMRDALGSEGGGMVSSFDQLFLASGGALPPVPHPQPPEPEPVIEEPAATTPAATTTTRTRTRTRTRTTPTTTTTQEEEEEEEPPPPAPGYEGQNLP